MKYKTIFYDIDGTLYDNTKVIPDNEKNILSFYSKLEKVPDQELSFWVPYEGLTELIKQIPQKNLGIISNGVHHLQIDKLRLFGLSEYFNPELIFTSYGEAEKVLDNPNHPLLKDFRFQSNTSTNVNNMTFHTQKPEDYMFKRALEVCNYAPDECVMIGDDWKDIKGAQKVGMKTIYINGVKDIDKEYFDPVADGDIIPDYFIQKGDIKSLKELLI